jgi:hypothetical protein
VTSLMKTPFETCDGLFVPEGCDDGQVEVEVEQQVRRDEHEEGQVDLEAKS